MRTFEILFFIIYRVTMIKHLIPFSPYIDFTNKTSIRRTNCFETSLHFLSLQNIHFRKHAQEYQ